MKNGHCTSCAGKCAVSVHVKEKWIYVSKTRKIKTNKTDMKRKYDENKTGSESQLSLLEALNKKINDLEKDKDQCLEKCYQHVMSLENIALQAHSIHTAVYLDLLIKKMKEKGDSEKVTKLEEINNQVDKDTRAAMSYKLSGGKEAR